MRSELAARPEAWHAADGPEHLELVLVAFTPGAARQGPTPQIYVNAVPAT